MSLGGHNKHGSSYTQFVLWWLVWAGLLIAILFIYMEIGISKMVPDEPDMSMVYLGLQPLILSCVIRWVVLPRISRPRVAFQLFITGMILADVSCYIGMFLAEQWKEELFFLGLLGMIQFIPVYVKRYRDI